MNEGSARCPTCGWEEIQGEENCPNCGSWLGAAHSQVFNKSEKDPEPFTETERDLEAEANVKKGDHIGPPVKEDGQITSNEEEPSIRSEEEIERPPMETVQDRLVFREEGELQLEDVSVVCPNCQEKISSSEKVCPNCGTSLDTPPQHSWIRWAGLGIAGLILLFLIALASSWFASRLINPRSVQSTAITEAATDVGLLIGVVQTSAAQTVSAEHTRIADPTSDTPLPPTSTPLPTTVPTPTRTYTPIPSSTKSAIPVVTSVDLGPFPTTCNKASFLRPGVEAYVQGDRELFVYGINRYLIRPNNPVQETLPEGTKVLILDHADLPYDCTGNSLLWKIQYDDDQVGFALEFYFRHSRDDFNTTSKLIDGYYLGANPP